jgi:hypothetical protein
MPARNIYELGFEGAAGKNTLAADLHYPRAKYLRVFKAALVSLAIKYRPRTFEELGHDPTPVTLM